MPHTRSYIGISEDENKVYISFKNISKEEIDYNPDELTQRVVRGDKSRNTEGSGLGLAIAKSFVQMQGGEFSISSEGDLFKVEIIFYK